MHKWPKIFFGKWNFSNRKSAHIIYQLSISYRHCIQELLANKIILLTTHDTKYYHEADHIVHLRDGKIEVLETYTTFSDSNLGKGSEKNKKKIEALGDSGERERAQTLKPQEEGHEIGRVAFNVYKEYFLFGGSALVLIVIALVFFSGQGKKCLHFDKVELWRSLWRLCF